MPRFSRLELGEEAGRRGWLRPGLGSSSISGQSRKRGKERNRKKQKELEGNSLEDSLSPLHAGGKSSSLSCLPLALSESHPKSQQR